MQLLSSVALACLFPWKNYTMDSFHLCSFSFPSSLFDFIHPSEARVLCLVLFFIFFLYVYYVCVLQFFYLSNVFNVVAFYFIRRFFCIGSILSHCHLLLFISFFICDDYIAVVSMYPLRGSILSPWLRHVSRVPLEIILLPFRHCFCPISFCNFILSLHITRRWSLPQSAVWYVLMRKTAFLNRMPMLGYFNALLLASWVFFKPGLGYYLVN